MKIWFYIDGEGAMSLLDSEPVQGGKALPPPAFRTAYVHNLTVYAHNAKSLCGSDGWGWHAGETISAGQGANGSTWTTQYSHAGRAVRIVSNASGSAVSSTDVASGIKPGTSDDCAGLREQVLK